MLKAQWTKYRLNFYRESRTSREVLNVKDTYFIRVFDSSNPAVTGYGEAGLFRGLSADDTPDFEAILDRCCRDINGLDIHSVPSSAIRMGMETAIDDIKRGGAHQPFFEGVIPPTRINGLIWMGSKQFMLDEIEKKLEAGFHCLKLKIGGIDFEHEVEILHCIRQRFGADVLEIRLDANGAFNPGNALQRLDRIAAFDIHSIEQPIKAGQIESMAMICRESPVAIALDEELIGIKTDAEKQYILQQIRPRYIILKPTLCGGFAEADKWIEMAVLNGIDWWATSALESNIGLNAIARWAAAHGPSLPQGLGTGLLYSNNVPSPLLLKGEQITSNPDNQWDFSVIKF